MKYIFLLFITAFASQGFSQTASDLVVRKSCDCIVKENVTIQNYEEFMALLVQCVSPQLMENLDALKKEYGIKDASLTSAMEQVGQKVGEKMVYDCPKFASLTMKLLGEDDQFMDIAKDEITKRRNTSEKMAEAGTISSVEIAFPCQLAIHTEGGETLNVLWLDNITMDPAYITNPAKLKGKKVTFVYEIRNMYDAKLGKYVSKKVLQELNL